MRHKKEVAALVLEDKPFVYTSGKYPSEFEKTTVVGLLAEHPGQKGGALVFDLRYDPSAFVDLSPEELAEAMRRRSDEEGPRLPIKTLKYNRCPAVAPLSVLDDLSKTRIDIAVNECIKNFHTLKHLQDQLEVKIKLAIELLDKAQQAKLLEDEMEVDGRLYEGFFSDSDKTKMSLVRASQGSELSTVDVVFHDGRLSALLPLYKARNYPKTLNDDEIRQWEQYRERKLLGGGVSSRANRYFTRLAELFKKDDLSPKQTYILEELQLYGESILPNE
jgi:exodeoxyribonuclease-1